MTYRYVPPRLRLLAQLSTLAATALIGVSIALTPQETDPKLSQIERAMNADVWAVLLIVFGAIGFVIELWITLHPREAKTRTALFWVVSACHLMLLSLLVAYSAAALVGMIRQGMWYNFGAPVLGMLLAEWHYIYIHRKPRTPAVSNGEYR